MHTGDCSNVATGPLDPERADRSERPGSRFLIPLTARPSPNGYCLPKHAPIVLIKLAACVFVSNDADDELVGRSLDHSELIQKSYKTEVQVRTQECDRTSTSSS
jgi:hypothetical protein